MAGNCSFNRLGDALHGIAIPEKRQEPVAESTAQRLSSFEFS